MDIKNKRKHQFHTEGKTDSVKDQVVPKSKNEHRILGCVECSTVSWYPSHQLTV
jgi:hypothetical protein